MAKYDKFLTSNNEFTILFLPFLENPDVVLQPEKQCRNATMFFKDSCLKLLDVKNRSFIFSEPDLRNKCHDYLNLTDLKGPKDEYLGPQQ